MVRTATATAREFMEQTTFHGLREIAEGRSSRERVFHIVLVLVTYSVTVYGIYHIMSSYSTKPVISTVMFQEEDSLDLPDINLCLFNRFDSYYFEKNQIPEILRMFLEWSFFPVNPSYDFADLTKSRTLLKFFKPQQGEDIMRDLHDAMRRLNISDLRNMVDRASFKCSDIVQHCHLTDPWVRETTECCKQENIVTHYSDFGRCFRVLSKPQVLPGVLHGMRFALKIPVDNFSYSETMLLNDGILIKLNEKGTGQGFDAIFSPTGVHMLLQLQAFKMEFMNDPPRYTCKHTHTSLNQCYRYCKLRMIQDNCNCSYITDETRAPTRQDAGSEAAPIRTCTPKDMFDCTYEFILQNEKSIDHKCRSRCYQRCNYWEFTATVTYNLLDAERRDWIYLDVYFDKISYTLLKHQASMTFDNFVADIGGQVGLWMGGSILSIIHMTVFIVLWVCARRDKQQGIPRENTEETVKTVDTGVLSTEAHKID